MAFQARANRRSADPLRIRRSLRVEPLEARTMLDAAGWVDTLVLDIDGDGRQDVVGRDSTTGAWELIRDRNGEKSVVEIGAWNPGISYKFVHAADLDGDGADEVVAQDESGAWWALKKNGDSFVNQYLTGWTATVEWETGTYGDWDGDGRTDILARSRVTGDWWTVRFDGSGYQSVRLGNWAPGSSFKDVHLIDIDGDQVAELVGRDDSNAWWMLKKENDAARESVFENWPADNSWDDVVTGNFTGDEGVEIIGRSRETGDWWLVGSTDLGFTSRFIGHWNTDVIYSTPSVIDLNGDGLDEVVAQDELGSWWALKDIDGEFKNEFLGGWNTDLTWDYLGTFDFDGDGLQDIVGHIVDTGGWVVIHYADGVRMNHSLANTTPGLALDEFVQADLDGDGRMQLVARTPWDERWALEFATAPNVQIDSITVGQRLAEKQANQGTYTAASAWDDVQKIDIDGDGHQDIVGRITATGEWWVLRGGTSGTNSERIASWGAGEQYQFTVTADFNGDGLSEVAALDEDGNWWALRYQQGQFVTVHLASWNPDASWNGAVAGDFNGDGHDEIAAQDTATGEWWIVERDAVNSGFHTYRTTPQYPGMQLSKVSAADITGDHHDDILGCDQLGNWWAFAWNGTGFTRIYLADWGAGSLWTDVLLVDFDGDGTQALLGRNTTNGNWCSVTVLNNVAHDAIVGNWNPQSQYSSVHVFDVDGDGKQDIVGRDDLGSWWAVKDINGQLRNQFLGGWSTKVNWDYLGSADIDGDGATDILGHIVDDGGWWVIRFNGTTYINERLTIAATPTTEIAFGAIDISGDSRAEFVGQSASGEWWQLTWENSTFTTSYLGTGNGAREKALVDLIVQENPGLVTLLDTDRLAAADQIVGWAATVTDFDLGGMQAWYTPGMSQSPADWYFDVFANDTGGGSCGVYATFATNVLKLFGYGDAFYVDFGTLQDDLTHVITIVPIQVQGQWQYYMFDPTANTSFVDQFDGHQLTFVDLVDRLRTEQIDTIDLKQRSNATRDFLSVNTFDGDKRMTFEANLNGAYLYRWLNYDFNDLPAYYIETMTNNGYSIGLPGYIELMENSVFNVGPGRTPDSAARQGFLDALDTLDIPYVGQN